MAAMGVCGCPRAKLDHQPTETGNSESGKLVTFDTPTNWVLQNHVTKTNSESFQFLIPDSATDGTPDSANAGVSIEPAHGGLDLPAFASARLHATSGYTVLTNIFDNTRWCSDLARGQQNGTPYLIMDRFGLDQGVMVLFRVAQPILTNNRAAVALSISNFNDVVRSLKIGGSNSVNSEMRQDHGTIWLRALGDMDTNWMVSPTNKLIYRSARPL